MVQTPMGPKLHAFPLPRCRRLSGCLDGASPVDSRWYQPHSV